jgi:uncharacterized protein (TIGR00730 family)
MNRSLKPLVAASSTFTASSEPADEIFLEGPRSRFAEFFTLLRVVRDFLRGFRALHFVGPCVTVFGSARIKSDDPHYELARKMGAAIARLGFTVITGGGPGIMEAANRGAREAGAPSIGFNITLPMEQGPNSYSTPDLTFNFHYFAMRKMHLAMRANALAVFPGGFGTLDELFEILTLIQTQKAPPIPVVLFGRDYWRKLMDFDFLVEQEVCSPADLELFDIVDDAEEAWQAMLRRGLKSFAPERIT